MPPNVKEKVKERLADKGSLSAGDLSEFSKAQEREDAVVEAPEPDPLKETSTIAVPVDTAHDPALADEVTDNEHIEQALRNDPAGLALPIMEVEVTAEEKAAFLDAIVDGSRYTQPFSLYAGKVTGVFRSRTTRETRAVMGELFRQLREGIISGDDDYQARVRHALLRLHVQELQNVEYGVPAEPLMAQAGTGTDGKPVTNAPAWVEEAEAFYGSEQQEALVSAVYEALRKFEQKYWAMVEHADDQNFWQTEDSTLA